MDLEILIWLRKIWFDKENSGELSATRQNLAWYKEKVRDRQKDRDRKKEKMNYIFSAPMSLCCEKLVSIIKVLVYRNNASFLLQIF